MPPTIVVNVQAPATEPQQGMSMSPAHAPLSCSLEPPKKKPEADPSLASWLSKGAKQDDFLKDVVRAFATSNVPLSKLDKDGPVRKLFDKYMAVEGQQGQQVPMVDPNNLRGTWLKKVWTEGTRKLANLIPVD